MSVASPLVSIITPTFNRPNFLPAIYQCVAAQDMADFEWLVLDDSPAPSTFMQSLGDPRVSYLHRTDKQSTGLKRNLLIERSRGDIIALFDDDDYYGSGYLSRMLSMMRSQNADFIKLFGFFLYSQIHDLFAYWDLQNNHGPHYKVSDTTLTLTSLDPVAFKSNHLGYGFSYVFKKYVWDAIKFPDLAWNSDAPFAISAADQFGLMGIHDVTCECLHVLHRSNISACFPQYLLPRFLLDRLFPNFKEQILQQTVVGGRALSGAKMQPR
jgi:glycosyltransferase involved in cell wall biosynthesis